MEIVARTGQSWDDLEALELYRLKVGFVVAGVALQGLVVVAGGGLGRGGLFLCQSGSRRCRGRRGLGGGGRDLRPGRRRTHSRNIDPALSAVGYS